jgi:hypothetical protein
MDRLFRFKTNPTKSESNSAKVRRESDCLEETSSQEGSEQSEPQPIIFNTTSDIQFDEFVEEIRPESNWNTAHWLYEPPLDPWTREVATMRTLRPFSTGSSGNGFLFYELFPSVNDYLESLALDSDGLRHSFLAMSALLRDLYLGNEPGQQFYISKASSLKLLQAELSSAHVNEHLLVAIIIQIFMDLCFGRVGSLQHHLNGMYQVFRALERQANAGGQSLTAGALFVRRMAARTDSAQAALFGEFPQWPVLTSQDEVEDREWLMKFTGPSKGMTYENVEWALASFEINNLWHRTYSFAKKSEIYRGSKDPQAEIKIKTEYKTLRQGFELWGLRDVIVNQAETERYAQRNAPSDPANLFLWYEPLYLQHTYYGKHTNSWRAVQIYASLIVNPSPGPDCRTDFDRFAMAVELCRMHAALGKNAIAGPQWQALFWAGFAFGNEYPAERNWVLEKEREAAAVFPVYNPQVDRMTTAWTSKRVHWNAFGALWHTNT